MVATLSTHLSVPLELDGDEVTVCALLVLGAQDVALVVHVPCLLLQTGMMAAITDHAKCV